MTSKNNIFKRFSEIPVEVILKIRHPDLKITNTNHWRFQLLFLWRGQEMLYLICRIKISMTSNSDN